MARKGEGMRRGCHGMGRGMLQEGGCCGQRMPWAAEDAMGKGCCKQGDTTTTGMLWA